MDNNRLTTDFNRGYNIDITIVQLHDASYTKHFDEGDNGTISIYPTIHPHPTQTEIMLTLMACIFVYPIQAVRCIDSGINFDRPVIDLESSGSDSLLNVS
jgi:hypothetical protein